VLLSGSATWGLRFPQDLHEPGVRVLQHGLRFDTPWGPSDGWQVLELDRAIVIDDRPRQVLNVFSHGWPPHHIDHATHQRVAWILGQAGARKVLADSTCGSLNRALRPRDFVIAADLLDLTQTLFSALPGRFTHLCQGSQLFCPALGHTVETVARELWPASGRVYGHSSGLVVVHNWGPRFNTAAEARAYQLLGADIINQSIGAEANGAREVGACFISASYVVSYESGVVPDAGNELDAIHHELALASGRISLRTLARADLSAPCACEGYRTQRPSSYALGSEPTVHPQSVIDDTGPMRTGTSVT
jgi:5'-methylthioadenosine phosphorylase